MHPLNHCETPSKYAIAMPDSPSFMQVVNYSADTIFRDIGYVPGIGAAVGIPRIAVGIFQKVVGGKGSLDMNEGASHLKFVGSRMGADGEANILRGALEAGGFGYITILRDIRQKDRYFIIPGYRPERLLI